jgi:hypothetical protein
MTSEMVELQQSRQLLQNAIDAANALLDQLEDENKGREGYVKQIADSRIAIFDQLINAIVNFDSKVVRYQNFNPPGNGYQYYKEKLQIARKYIHQLGGDFNSVLWGKITDYPY